MLKSHSDTLSKQEIKELQTIDLDLFRSGGGGGAGSSGGFMARMAGGRNSARGTRPEDEYEFAHSADAPPRPPAFEEVADQEEFPSLGGFGGGGAAASGSGSGANARYGVALAAPAAGMPRSRSQPMQLSQSGGGGGAAGRLFARESREEAFPSLGSSVAGPPLAHAAGPGTSTDTGFRVRGPPPPREEFPTLRQVVKQEAKHAKKADAKAQQQQQQKKQQAGKDVPSSSSAAAASAAAPSPTPSPPPDTRTNLSVPLPLPPAVPSSEVAGRNKALVAAVKAGLRQDPDSFETFKALGARYRDGDISAQKYLNRFKNLFARNPAGEADTERLLVELCALLPDEAQRTNLHAEYARAKLMANMERLKEKNAAAAAAASAADAASSAAAASSYAAPKARPIASLGAAGPAASSSASSSSSSSSSTAPSFAKVASPGTFEVVQTARDARESRQEARKAARAQGIGAFEGVAVRPLKRDEDDGPADFLSVVAAEREKKERAEREAKEAQARPPPGMAKPATKTGWVGGGGDTAAGLAGPSGRAPPGLAGGMSAMSISHSASSPALTNLSRQTSWSVLGSEDGDGDEPSQIAEPVGAAGPSGRGKAQRAAAAAAAASRRSPSPTLPEYDPPLQASASASGAHVLPDLDELENHVLRISALRIAPAAKSPLELLALLFQHVCLMIQQRCGGSINAPANRRHQMGEQARQSLQSMLRQTRWVHALEFSRAARLGLTPSSVQLLSGVAGMYTRYGAELGGDHCVQALSSMSAPELFLLLEYLHGLLTQLTKASHPDLREAEAAFAADEERRQRQNEQFGGRQVKQLKRDGDDGPAAAADTLKWDGAGAKEDLYERPSASSSAAASSSGEGGGGPKKGKKQKVLLFKSGGL
jgi:hypothetical protein